MEDNRRGSIEENTAASLSSMASSSHQDSATTRVVGQKSRWSKLRGTIQVTNAASSVLLTTRHNHQLTREDSFLKKFSTRQSGAPYVQADAADRATDDTVTSAGSESNTAADPGRVDLETGGRTREVRRPRWRKRTLRCLVVNPDESPMFYWLTLTALAVLYNLWTWYLIKLRAMSLR